MALEIRLTKCEVRWIRAQSQSDNTSNSICLAVTSHDQCGVLQPAQRPFFKCPRTTRSTTTHVFLCPLVVNVSQCACASQTRKRPEKTNSPLQVLMSLAPLRAVVRIPRRRERSTR
ncbi:hypothetical protein F2P81_009649 [Scophthalmus maximus]|uniref:Uncharacterized protein n=1 Tax=Scophthalmus maximus TaxID=52904 RepID=A0A6A4T252_SCOMX|nr:hypothetical protein F2P81_009649 [Scophthalmus maximus]